MPTIKDIARVSGVSYPTVSHVLNRTRKVSAKTQQKVFDAIEELGYIRNVVARGFITKRLNTFGIVCCVKLNSLFEDHCHGPIIEAALLAAQDFGQAGMLYFASSFPEKADRLSLYCDGRCDGMILVGQPTDSELVLAMKKRNFPFVCVKEIETVCDVPFVDVDQFEMAEILANYLLELGHRKFLVLKGDDYMPNVEQRRIGFQNRFDAWEVPSRNVTWLHGVYKRDSGYNRAKKYLSETERKDWPTAILCMNDFLAHGAIDALNELGVPCPAEMSVVGIDDARTSATFDPPLTTMHQPFKLIGHKAVETLVGIIDGNSDTPLQVNLPATLIVRQSSAPPNKFFV